MAGDMELRIDSLGNGVGGVSRPEGSRTVFVRGALPGELVRCSVEKEAKSYVRASLLEVLEPSPYRMAPSCSYFGRCGGCSLQHFHYSRQLYWKREWILRAMARADVEVHREAVLQTVPSPREMGYRNRVSFDMTPEGPGLHMHRGDPIPVEGCPLMDPVGSRVFRQLAGRSMQGCRRISVRSSAVTGESMVEFSGMPDRGFPPLGMEVACSCRENGDWVPSAPETMMHEMLGDLKYRISPGAFFQVNSGSAGLLAQRVAAFADRGHEVLDIYGGCGTFALQAAGRGAVVTSVEMSLISSEDGRTSARENGITGVSFVTSRARHFLLDTVRSGRRWDAVIVDPPRSGLGTRVARLLRRIDSPLVLYVSCNPFSLARDLATICEKGWRVAGIEPVDMFPQTDHIEMITELRRM